jgi:ribosomal protein S18 acetylase RimI-like enzyme
MIKYQIENDLNLTDFRKVLFSSTLAERRPINDSTRLEKMLRGANLIITARENDNIIGVARSLSDFTFCTYLSDIAVDKNYQKQGIGRELIKRIKIASGDARVILISAPKAIGYYPNIGMKRHEYCYYIDSIDELK